MMDRKSLSSAFLQQAGWDDATRGPLAGDASFRRYERLRRKTGNAVLMDAPPPQEDVRPFVKIARWLERHGFSAPRILAEDVQNGFLLLEDLGDDLYARLLRERQADEEALYAAAIDVLLALRAHPAAALAPYDAKRLIDEAMLFIDWYLPALTGAPADDAVRQSFAALWQSLAPEAVAQKPVTVLFDYHVDNLLLIPGRKGVKACGLLDFQDAVRAPLCFDLMSLVEDARRDLSPGLAPRLVARYRTAFPEDDPAAFATAWAVMGAQRHVRILGTFARLRARDGKPGYSRHMPRVWGYLEAAAAHPALAPVAAWLDANLPPIWRGLPPALRDEG